MSCIKNVEVDTSKCLPPCSGIILTSFFKSKQTDNLESKISETLSAYGKYTKWSTFPSELKGKAKIHCINSIHSI